MDIPPAPIILSLNRESHYRANIPSITIRLDIYGDVFSWRGILWAGKIWRFFRKTANSSLIPMAFLQGQTQLFNFSIIQPIINQKLLKGFQSVRKRAYTICRVKHSLIVQSRQSRNTFPFSDHFFSLMCPGFGIEEKLDIQAKV